MRAGTLWHDFVWLALTVGAAACDITHSSPDFGDAAADGGGVSCVVDAGPDVDPLTSCSPSGCIPFDNSVVPSDVPRL